MPTASTRRPANTIAVLTIPVRTGPFGFSLGPALHQSCAESGYCAINSTDLRSQHAKRQADRYVPILPALADETRTHLQGRRQGFPFECNRHTRYSTRMVQSVVKDCARRVGIAKRVNPHLLRHSVATILLDSRAGSHRPGAEILWATCIFQPRRSMLGRACGPSVATTSGRWEASGRERYAFNSVTLPKFGASLERRTRTPVRLTFS